MRYFAGCRPSMSSSGLPEGDAQAGRLLALPPVRSQPLRVGCTCLCVHTHSPSHTSTLARTSMAVAFEDSGF